MANHYRHEPTTRRDRAIERLLELLTRLIETWVEFWHGTQPHQHDQGATDRFADTLHDIDITAVHDGLSTEVGRYALLSPDLNVDIDVPGWTLPEELAPVEMTAWTKLDGHALAASLDQNGGAV